MQEIAAQRLCQLPPYLFVEIDRRKQLARAAGKDVIDFGIGDPDTPTPDFIVDRLIAAVREPANHRYPPGIGKPNFRRACAAFFKRRFQFALDPDRHVLALVGSKEGIGHLPLAVVNPGDVVLVPDPGYPVYTSSTLFAGGRPHVMPLRPDAGWLPDLDAIPAAVANRTRLIYLNYPNNPTGAVTDRCFLEKALRFADKHDILLAHDAAYCEVSFGEPPPSIFEIDGAMERAVEFHSLSKTFNMTGWRVGFAVGHPEVITALAKVKNNVDSGVFGAVQDAAAEALDHYDHASVRAMIDLYRERRDIVVDGLNSIGFGLQAPQATFYIWAKCPNGYTSMECATKALDDAAVVLVPGVGFGQHGEGYVRIALTVDADRTREAMDRLRGVTW